MNRKTCTAGCILLFAILAMAPSLRGEAFEAQVIGVQKGNLLKVQHEGKRIELVLYGLECPAPDQPQGEQALEFTSKMVLDRKVRIEVQERESPLKIVGSVVLPDGSLLNHKLVQNGLASWDRKAAPNDIKLQTLEDSAKKLNLGIWASSPPAMPSIPVKKKPGSPARRPSTALPRAAVFSTVLALLVAVAVAVLFVLKARGPRQEGSSTAPSPPARPQAPPAPGGGLEEQAEALESGRNAIEDLLKSLSEFVSDLMNKNTSYDNKMRDHKASID